MRYFKIATKTAKKKVPFQISPRVTIHWGVKLWLFFWAVILISCDPVSKQNTENFKDKIPQKIDYSKKENREKYLAQWIFPPKDSSMLCTLEQQKALAPSEDDMKWYKDAKFGVFVHWGPALRVTDRLSWGRQGDRPGARLPEQYGVPADTYDQQYKYFNPVNFDADKWMQQVKAFGAKYIVFTTKHHDGFCMFDAPNTDYDIMSTPFKRDIAKELADAAHKHGVKLFWYYSQPDWTHPDCLRENHYEKYLPYMKSHIEHLFTQYGKIDGVFWDGLATKYWQWDAYNLITQMKKWQPGLLCNPRSGAGWPDGKHRGAFDTPEQSLGPVNHHRYWESCLTMTDRWLYKKDGPIKTADGILGMLIQVVGNGGNLLLNLGPDGKGEFVQKEVAEAQKIGQWLKKYGYTLYDTRRGIYISGDWGAATQKGNTLYLHFLQKLSNDATAVFELPALPVKIRAAKGLTDAFKSYTIKDNKLIVTFDKEKYGQNLDNIVELSLEKSPEGYKRIKTWHAEPITSKDFSFKASSFLSDKYKPEVIFQDRKNVFNEGIKLKNRWTPADKDTAPEMDIDFKEPKRIKTVLLSEQMLTHSVSDFDIFAKDTKGQWYKIYNGSVIGEGLRIKLNAKPITGLKLKINKTKYQTQITAFNAYE